MEGVTIRTDPKASPHKRIAVPLSDSKGRISDRFGEAPFFAVVQVRKVDRRIEEQRVVENPHLNLAKGRGIRLAEWLVGQKVDEVRLREDIRNKGPGYVFGDAGLTVRMTEARHLDALLEEIFPPAASGGNPGNPR